MLTGMVGNRAGFCQRMFLKILIFLIIPANFESTRRLKGQMLTKKEHVTVIIHLSRTYS
jgi:hypothetical protein